MEESKSENEILIVETLMESRLRNLCFNVTKDKCLSESRKKSQSDN